MRTLRTMLPLGAAIIILGISFWGCGGSKSEPPTDAAAATAEATPKAPPDDSLGTGPARDMKFDMSQPINHAKADEGKGIFDLKCQGCHSLANNRVVGPGFKNLTQRRKPAWIINMITNTEVMLEKDPEAQKLLARCMTRMPNQGLSNDDALKVLEFARRNDGAK